MYKQHRWLGETRPLFCFLAALCFFSTPLVAAGDVPMREWTAPASDKNYRVTVSEGLHHFPVEEYSYSILPGYRSLALDFYRPADHARLHPLIVAIHGGAGLGGDSRGFGSITDAPAMYDYLAEHGYAVASINYRLSAEAPFPAGLSDLRAALAFLRGHAHVLGIDAGQIVLWGESVGAQLAAIESFGSRDTGVKGMVGWYGAYDMAPYVKAGRAMPSASQNYAALSQYMGCDVATCADATVAASSPVTFIRKDAPPALLIHGRADHLAPFSQSEEFYQKAKAAGAQVEFLALPFADHYFAGKTQAETSEFNKEAFDRTFAFFEKNLKL